MEKRYQDKDYFNDSEIIRTYFYVPERSKDMHTQTFWEMAYPFDGSGNAFLNDTELNIQQKDFILISPGYRHDFASKPKEEGAPLWICSCIFTEKYFDSIIEEYKQTPDIQDYALYKKITGTKPFGLHIPDDKAGNVHNLLWLVAHEYNHFTVGSEKNMRNGIISLLIYITRLHEYQINSTLSIDTQHSDLNELIRYISSNYGSKLSLDLLAANMHLSREYLCRYFKKHTGKTIFDFILETRINQAKQMLRTTSHTVTDIGIYCGYPSVSCFQKAFKKVVGMSPNEFRALEKSKI